MQDESKPKKIPISCNNCDKFLAIYTGFENTIFKDDFYCNLICEDQHKTKKRKKKEMLTEKTISK